MKIAIAILVKNEEPRLKELTQTLKSADVDLTVFFDDGSEDDTWQTLTKIKKVIKDFECRKDPLPKSFAGKKNHVHDKLEDYDFILHIDADEKWDPYFLENVKKIIKEIPSTLSFAFPRVNQPNAINYPDYQVRLVANNKEVGWLGDVHERPYTTVYEEPLLDMQDKFPGKINDDGDFYCFKLEKYPILHLPRRTDIKRPWW